MISDCLEQMDSSTLIGAAVNMSINVSNLTLIDSPISRSVETTDATKVVTGAATKVEKPEATTFKPKKRLHSPLPSPETDGPKMIPSAGGFNGDGIIV